MFTIIRRHKNLKNQTAQVLYTAIMDQARQPVFYTDYAVPDSVDGRFEMVLLHVFPAMIRLRDLGEEGRVLSQALYDVMFVDMDRAIREIGVGDLSVKKHIRRMMKAFNGRMQAYEDGLKSRQALIDALCRNLFGTVKDDVQSGVLDGLALYLEQTSGNFQQVSFEDIRELKLPWGSPGGETLKKSA